MLLKDINDSEIYINEFVKILSKFEIDGLFLNTVVRPPLNGSTCKSLSTSELQKIAKSFESLGVQIELADPTIPQKRKIFPNRD